MTYDCRIGKSTLAVAVEAALHARKHHCYRLDGDNIRLVSVFDDS
jgi:adenylylsulfate kinase-like enzyme